jgi:host factor-I protein
MSELDTNIPSNRQVTRLIQGKMELEIKLLTGDLLAGTILWQDPDAVCLIETENNEKQTIISRHAIAFIRSVPVPAGPEAKKK